MSEKDFFGDLFVDVEVDVCFDIELFDYEGIIFMVDVVEVDEVVFDVELENMCVCFGMLILVDCFVVKGDFVEFDFVVIIDGVEIDCVEGVFYEIGFGELFEGIDDVIELFIVGEDIMFCLVFVGGDYVGKEVEVFVIVKVVKECEFFEVDDDFV